MIDLNKIESRLSHIPAGPWVVDERIACIGVVAPALTDSPGLGRDYPGVIAYWGRGDQPNEEALADFIAHAREDIPALIAENRDLRRQMARPSVSAVVRDWVLAIRRRNRR